MFVKLIRGNKSATQLTGCGGVVLLEVIFHLLYWNWLVTSRTQLNVTNTVALVKFKSSGFNSTLAET